MIRVESIHKYFGDSHVLKGVDLLIPEGSVTALIGPSGSGKSTLLRSINLLEWPQKGRLQIAEESLAFDGVDPRKKRQEAQRLRRLTGMVFQNFQLFPHLTVADNVMEGLVTVLKWNKADAKARAHELLTKVGMAHKADAWPSSLSGGQQQRVAIARALAPSPKVLLCDEPTSALDPELAIEVVAVLKQLAAEGVTMVMATHDLRLASTIAEQVVFLEDGKIVESGSGKALFTTPQNPRTAEFISSLSGHSLG